MSRIEQIARLLGAMLDQELRSIPDPGKEPSFERQIQLQLKYNDIRRASNHVFDIIEIMMRYR